MTETTTPTDEVVDQSSSDTRDASLLEQDNEQDSAVERQNDTDSSESNDSGSDSSSSTDDGSDEDKGLAKFAQSQGYDLETMTDNEKKLLGTLRKNSAEKRKEVEAEKKRKVNDQVEELTTPTKDDDASEVLLKRMARLETKEMTSNFWRDNQDDVKYEDKMAELLIEEKEKYGDDAAWRLAQNLPRLLREAKFADGAYDSDAARDAGRREERERLRKAQEGSAETSHATQGVAQSSKKVDKAWVENEYDPTNPEHQKLLDTAISRGDLY